MKRAYADRAYYLGDPDYVKIPLKKLMSWGLVFTFLISSIRNLIFFILITHILVREKLVSST